jgi:glycosyltransferase involved in cell wall biosynthesis
MEVAFPTGANSETLDALKRVEHVICVSRCLEDYIRFIAPRATVVQLSLGPHPDTFYPRDITRDPKSVAIAVSANPEKGSVHAMQIGLFLRERGFSLRFFGWEPDAILYPASLGEVLRNTQREALATLFSRTEFFVDCSRFEGLGLLPLEAAFCGCIPLLDVAGGPEYIFTNGKDCIDIGGYRHLPATIESIVNLTSNEKRTLSSNALKLRSKYALPDGLRKACIAIAELSGKTVDPAFKRKDYTPRWR